ARQLQGQPGGQVDRATARLRQYEGDLHRRAAAPLTASIGRSAVSPPCTAAANVATSNSSTKLRGTRYGGVVRCSQPRRVVTAVVNPARCTTPSTRSSNKPVG